MTAVLIPGLVLYSDAALLFMRLLVAAVFLSSGWGHVSDPVGRGKKIGMSPRFTVFLGSAEICGSLGVAFGALIQPAAIGLILLMLGAIQKKIFVWKTGFWGTKDQGWHYDLLIVAMNLVIAATGGGTYVLSPN